MRLLILAVDALEYDFVKSRRFPFIKQRQYHRVEIPEECLSYVEGIGYIPYTPVIWTTILTGKTPKEHGVTIEVAKRHWKNPILHRLEKTKPIKKIYVKMVEKKILPAGIFEKIGFKKFNPIENLETLLDLAKNPIVIRNPMSMDLKWRVKTAEFFGFEEAVKSHIKNFMRVTKETLNAVNKNWDLLFTYVKILDNIGHIYWHRPNIVEKYYRMVDYFAYQLRQKMPENSILVILSDHGMELMKGSKVGGDHSCHAFISFSQKVEVPDRLKITDIFYILRGLMEK